MKSRFPFTSWPRGWFVVALSSDLAPGQVRTVHYFDQDIVLFRTESGVVAAVEKTCPHLGAHLGVASHVKGECLRCPFHDWAFDTKGECVDVPYAPKIPPKAKVRAWPLREQDGLIFVFYSWDGSEPDWEIPLLDTEGWTPNRYIRWEVDSHPQEVCENSVDAAHLLPVHHVTRTDIVSVELKDHTMNVVLSLTATGAAIQMPEEINEVELDVWLHGIGQIISRTHVITAGLKTRQRIHATPIEHDRIAIFGVANTLEMPDPEYTKEIDQIFWDAFVEDFAKDFPIWSNKAYLERPLLAGGDGPIGRYRKWARQLYAPDPVAESAAPAAPPPAPKGRLERALELVKRVSEGPLSIIRRAPPPPPRAEAASAAADEPDLEAPTPGKPRPVASAAAASAAHFSSVDDYFSTLPARFEASAASGVDAVFQWVLTGEGASAHYAEVRGGQIRCGTGRHDKPTVTVEMSVADYLLMINGELNGARAFSTGRGKLRGPVTLAMKMQRLFPLDKADLNARPASSRAG